MTAKIAGFPPAFRVGPTSSQTTETYFPAIFV
jgi:hypothetical protein